MIRDIAYSLVKNKFLYTIEIKDAASLMPEANLFG